MPDVVPQINPDVQWAVADIVDRLDRIGLHKAYYEGDHRLLFATEKFRNAFGDLFREFADNLCDDVVDEPVDRLQIINWTAKDTTTSALAQDIWDTIRGESRTGEVHLNSFQTGDGWIICWPDEDGTARAYPQDPTQMAGRYSQSKPDQLDVAAKLWREGKRYRLNLYYANRIERYATKGQTNEGGIPKWTSFQPYEAEDEYGIVQAAVEPHEWGMPVHHFPRGTISRYGRSVLCDVIPIQDALNKSIADMLVAMEFHAYPQRWATGIQTEKDPDTGEEISPFRSGAERLWRTGNENASFGSFPQGDLSQMLEVQDSFKLEIARKGALPPHSINLRSGNSTAPSGLSLLVAEGKLIKRCKDQIRDWSPAHREWMAQLLTMNGHPTAAADIDCEWAPVETRDEKALMEILAAKRELGVSKRQVLLEAGYDEDEVQDFLDEAEAAAPDFMSGGRTSVPGPAIGQLGIPQAPQGAAGAPAPAMAG